MSDKKGEGVVSLGKAPTCKGGEKAQAVVDFVFSRAEALPETAKSETAKGRVAELAKALGAEDVETIRCGIYEFYGIGGER